MSKTCSRWRRRFRIAFTSSACARRTAWGRAHTPGLIFRSNRAARSYNTAQEAASRALVAQCVEAASAQLDIPPDRVVVGGFSQGGIMALSLLLTRPELMHAAVVWHSRLMAELLPLTVSHDALVGRKLWLSHGTNDNVIPLANALAVRHHMETLPVTVTYRECPGEHEIRPSELAATVAWLEGLSTTPTAF